MIKKTKCTLTWLQIMYTIMVNLLWNIQVYLNQQKQIALCVQLNDNVSCHNLSIFFHLCTLYCALLDISCWKVLHLHVSPPAYISKYDFGRIVIHMIHQMSILLLYIHYMLNISIFTQYLNCSKPQMLIVEIPNANFNIKLIILSIMYIFLSWN